MDVDCDGADNTAGGCSNDPSGQGVTAFKDEVSKYGISDLNANIHPYVVFGNQDSSPKFEPNKFGMEPLSVMAVVCNGQLVRITRSALQKALLTLPPIALWHLGRHKRRDCYW